MKLYLLNQKTNRWLISVLLKIMVLFGLSITMTNNVWALKCVQSPGESERFVENIGSVAVPPGIGILDGDILWRSENRTMNVQCWSDNGSGPEQVRMYFNPAKAVVASGIRIGMDVNGVRVNDVTVQPATVVPNVGMTADCSGKTEAWCKANNSLFFTINYVVYVFKKGFMNTDQYTGNNTLDMFQLDGPSSTGSATNFRYALTNLQSIRRLSCAVSLTTSPSSIRLGTLDASDAAVGKIIAERDFNVQITKSCDSPVVLTATYRVPTNNYYDNNTPVVGDVGLRFKKLNSGEYVQFTNVEPLADMTNTNQVTIPYRVELRWLSDTPTLTSYSAALSITVYYN